MSRVIIVMYSTCTLYTVNGDVFSTPFTPPYNDNHCYEYISEEEVSQKYEDDTEYLAALISVVAEIALY